jgi:nitroreductase
MMIDKKLQKALGLGDANKKVQLSIAKDNSIAETLETPELIDSSELNVLAAISTRRSIRAYTDQPITDEQLNTILNAGFCAPSAKNKRPWHFIVVRNKEQLTKLSETNIYSKMLPKCDCCIIVCGDKVLQGIKELLINDCSASTQNILLAAHGLGLGAVWCGVVLNSDWRKQITFNSNYRSQSCPYP